MIELGTLKVGDRFYLPHNPKSIVEVLFQDSEFKMTHFFFVSMPTFTDCFTFDTKVYAVR